MSIENTVYKIQDIDLLKNMRRYALRISHHPKENSQLEKILNQILSALKFTQ